MNHNSDSKPILVEQKAKLVVYKESNLEGSMNYFSWNFGQTPTKSSIIHSVYSIDGVYKGS
jgi:hypothetical protein